MSASGGGTAIIAALLANTGIAVTKFVAFLVSGSSAMLAESVHSVADAGNQLLLLVGGRRARKEADTEHPFGYGRARYIYAFIVAIILFSIGGVFSLSEGVSKLQNPHPLENAWLPVVVLLIAIVLESFSLRTAVRESNHVRGTQGWIQFIRRAKAPELPVVLLEDVAALLGLTFALLGVGLTILTGDALWDAVGTIMIGVLLVIVAVVLGLETSSLLVGEGASSDDARAIRAALDAHDSVTSVVHMKTLYLGPDELLVGAKVSFAPGSSIEQVAAIIDELEVAVREAVPIARVIYIEPGLVTVSAAR